MLVLLSGVSGAGKDTIKKELVKRMSELDVLPSYTDREPRPGDEKECKYVFVTKEQFKKMIENDEFYEYNLYTSDYYGVSKKLLNEKLNNNKIVIKDIDVNGAENLMRLLDDNTRIVTIFLKVPKNVLKKRLEEREDRPSMEKIEARLNRLEYEESKMSIYDYVIKNNDLEKTVQIIMSIIKSEMEVKNPEF